MYKVEKKRYNRRKREGKREGGRGEGGRERERERERERDRERERKVNPVSPYSVHQVHIYTLYIQNYSTTDLHENTHDPPAVVGATFRKVLVQQSSCLLLLLVLSNPYVGHEEVGQDVLVPGVVLGGISVQLRDLLNYKDE